MFVVCCACTHSLTHCPSHCLFRQPVRQPVSQFVRQRSIVRCCAVAGAALLLSCAVLRCVALLEFPDKKIHAGRSVEVVSLLCCAAGAVVVVLCCVVLRCVALRCVVLVV